MNPYAFISDTSFYQPHYCASKGAIDALTLALGRELAPRSRSHCITPGAFNARIMQTVFASPAPDWKPSTLIPHSGSEDIAKKRALPALRRQSLHHRKILYVNGGERLIAP